MQINLLNLQADFARSEFHSRRKTSYSLRLSPRAETAARQLRGHGRDAIPRPAFCRVATAPSRWNSAATSTTPPTGGCWRSTGRWPPSRSTGVTETVPTYRSLLVHYDPGADRLRRARRKDSRAGATAGAGDDKVPALAHSGGLWRRARHRPRGCRQNTQHHARRHRGAARRRRLPRRHDRLYARLVLSQRAGRLPADAAAAKPASADAGRHDLDRRRADRRAVPRRPERLASAGTDGGPHLSTASRSDLPAGARRPTSAFRRSMPRPSPSRIAPPKPARFIAEQIAS